MNIVAGTADVSIDIRCMTTAGAALEGKVAADFALWYRRDAAKTAISLSDLALLTTAHTDGGVKEIDDGWYRLDLPDAACAAGANRVAIGGTVDGGVVLSAPVSLDDLTLIKAEVDTALSDINLDHLAKVGDATLTNIVVDDTIFAHLMANGGTIANFNGTTDSLEIIGAQVLLTDGKFGTPSQFPDVHAALDTLATGCKVGSFTAGAIDATAIAANAIDAATFASDVDAEVRTWVWEAATADYGAAGTYGEALEAAGTAADPWLKEIPGEYLEGTAGYIIGTNLDAKVSEAGGGGLTAADIADAVWDETSTGHTDVAGKAGSRLWTDIPAILDDTDCLPASWVTVPTVAQIWTTQLTEAYSVVTVAPTAAQALFELLAMRNTQIVDTARTAYRLDGTTEAMTLTLGLDVDGNPYKQNRTA